MSVISDIYLGSAKSAFVRRGGEVLSPNPIRDGLVLWYDFKGRTNTDEQKGIAQDLSGNGNDGVLQNFAYQNGSGFSNELELDGIDDYIVIPDNPAVNPVNGASFEISLKAGKVGEYQRLIDKHYHNYSLALWASNKIKLEVGNTYAGFSNTSIVQGEKYHIVGVQNQTNEIAEIWINGILDFSIDTLGKLTPNGQSLYIGRGASKQNFTGILYSARVYNRALTPEEIQHNYQMEKERWNI